MAEISTYKCSNRKCSFVVRLSSDFPLWHPDTPKEMRTLPIHPSATSYVTRLRHEALCSACHSVVEQTTSAQCSRCLGVTMLITTQSECPRCKSGSFSLTNLSVF